MRCEEVRRFSRQLRPPVLDDLGLIPVLEWLAGELKKNV
jgi:signal transduction histidine kinase